MIPRLVLCTAIFVLVVGDDVVNNGLRMLQYSSYSASQEPTLGAEAQ